MQLGRTRILAGVGAVMIAVGAGQYMQSGAPFPSRYSRPEATPASLPGEITMLSASYDDRTEGRPPAAAPATIAAAPQPGPEAAAAPEPAPPSAPAPAPERLAALETGTPAPPAMPAEAQPEPAATAAPACKQTLALRPVPGALISLDLSAPCQAGQRMEVEHAGIGYAALLPPGGRYLALIPALAPLARVTVRFANAPSVSAETAVPDLADYGRAVLEWQGPGALQLHAYEHGAGYGGHGHVWSGAPGDPAQIAGGELLSFGEADVEPARRAEVYTAPATLGRVRLEMAAEVDRENCNRIQRAEVLLLRPGAMTVEAAPVEIDMPDCTGAGDFVLMPLPALTPVAAVARN